MTCDSHRHGGAREGTRRVINCSIGDKGIGGAETAKWHPENWEQPETAKAAGQCGILPEAPPEPQEGVWTASSPHSTPPDPFTPSALSPHPLSVPLCCAGPNRWPLEDGLSFTRGEAVNRTNEKVRGHSGALIASEERATSGQAPCAHRGASKFRTYISGREAGVFDGHGTRP